MDRDDHFLIELAYAAKKWRWLVILVLVGLGFTLGLLFV